MIKLFGPTGANRGCQKATSKAPLHWDGTPCTVRSVIVTTRGEDGMVQRDEGDVRSDEAGYDRRRFLRQAGLGVAGVAGGVLLDSAASSASPLTTGLLNRAAAGAPPKVPASLLAAAKKEGSINLIALPSNWANYGTQSTQEHGDRRLPCQLRDQLQLRCPERQLRSGAGGDQGEQGHQQGAGRRRRLAGHRGRRAGTTSSLTRCRPGTRSRTA